MIFLRARALSFSDPAKANAEVAQLQTEEELEELMKIAADYYCRLDQDEVETAIERLMKKRSFKTFAFDPRDPDLKAFALSLK
jgi:hypothetical protein